MGTIGWLRAAAVVALIAVAALPTPGTVRAAPGATDVVTVAAVNGNGDPINGYRIINRQPSANVSRCVSPSPAAVSSNIYTCDPSESAAQVCWPAPASVLCLFDPWSKTLRRFPSPGALPAVDPPAKPMPFALLLDDGTRCILPTGFDFGSGSDGRIPVYGCGKDSWGSGVVVAPGTDPAAAINRSGPQWTVIVGQLGPPNTPMGFVGQHAVTTAWFAGN